MLKTNTTSTRPGNNTPLLVSQYEMKDALISSKAETFLRRSWSLKDANGAIIVGFDAVIEAKVSTKPLWEQDNFNWYRVEYEGEVYYVADARNLVLEFIESNEPDNEPDLPDATQPALSAELIKLVDRLVEQRLQERVAGLEKLVAVDIPLPHATYHTTVGSLTTTISTLELFRNVLNAMIAGLKNTQPSFVIYGDMTTDLEDDIEIPESDEEIPDETKNSVFDTWDMT